MYTVSHVMSHLKGNTQILNTKKINFQMVKNLQVN